MKEKFNRNSPKINIGLVGNNPNETIEEKITKLENSKVKLSAATIDAGLKEELLNIIEETIARYESHNIHHR